MIIIVDVIKTAHFARYAESMPDGETSVALSEAARKNNVYVIGGTIPERENDKLYNTCTVWAPTGELVAKHRKVKELALRIRANYTSSGVFYLERTGDFLLFSFFFLNNNEANRS